MLIIGIFLSFSPRTSDRSHSWEWRITARDNSAAYGTVKADEIVPDLQLSARCSDLG